MNSNYHWIQNLTSHAYTDTFNKRYVILYLLFYPINNCKSPLEKANL